MVGDHLEVEPCSQPSDLLHEVDHLKDQDVLSQVFANLHRNMENESRRHDTCPTTTGLLTLLSRNNKVCISKKDNKEGRIP